MKQKQSVLAIGRMVEPGTGRLVVMVTIGGVTGGIAPADARLMAAAMIQAADQIERGDPLPNDGGLSIAEFERKLAAARAAGRSFKRHFGPQAGEGAADE